MIPPINLVVVAVIQLCPNLEAMDKEYVVNGYKVDCMEYYTNEIVSNPNKYKKELEDAKSK